MEEGKIYENGESRTVGGGPPDLLINPNYQGKDCIVVFQCRKHALIQPYRHV